MDVTAPFRRVLGWLDGRQAQRPWLAVPLAAAKKFGEDRAGNLAALLAYYGFFSLFPLLLVLVSLLGMVLSGSHQAQQDVLDSALADFPVIGDQLRANAGRLDASGLALVAGGLSALWAGTGVVKAAQDAMNDVWDVPMRARPNFLIAAARSFAMLVVVATAVVATTLLTGALGAVSAGAPAEVGGLVLGGALDVGLFLVAFRVLTVRDTPVRQLLPGAVLAGLAWVGLQVLGGYLLSHHVDDAGETYGTFAVVIGLLWWIYLQAQIVLYAAELNVVLARGLWPRSLTGDGRPTDRRTLRQHAQVEKRAPDQDIEVTFDEDPPDTA
jgi:YihY family inner membrane protein